MTPNSSKQPTVAVFADAQNVNLFRYSHAILNFVNSLGGAPCLYAYHHWRSISPKKEHKLQSQNWRCIDVPIIARNELDKLLINDFSDLCRFWQPDILVLITNDGDFAALVRYYLGTGRKVIVIGYEGKVSRKLQCLVPKSIYFTEKLYRSSSIAA